MKSILICRDYRIFRLVCDMYGFDPKKVCFAVDEFSLQGIHPETPIFKYYSAGYPHWLTPLVSERLASKFKNRFDLPEICRIEGHSIEDFRFKPAASRGKK